MLKKTPPVPKATREDVVALIERFGLPAERLRIRNWPLFARALAREARRHGLPVPRWLIYPIPATALRIVKRRSSRAASSDLSSPRTRVRKLPSRGRGIIVVGTT